MKIINIHIMKKITFSILFVWLSLSLWAAGVFDSRLFPPR